MKWWNNKNTVEEVVEKTEQRFVIEVGHNRNSELIIKKMRVSGDDLEQCIADLQLALQDFQVLRAVTELTRRKGHCSVTALKT